MTGKNEIKWRTDGREKKAEEIGEYIDIEGKEMK